MLRAALLLSSCLLAASIGNTEERTITLVADAWCPFNCMSSAGDRGLLVERAAAALALQGLRIQYEEVPWSRAILGVRSGQYEGIVGAARDETPDFHFPPKPLAAARYSLYTMPSSTWEYRGPDTLQELRLGVIQDYSYGGLREDYIIPNLGDTSRLVVLRGDRVLPRLVKMLKLGRIDALIAEEQVLDHHFQSTGQDNTLRHAGLARTESLYVAFSPALQDGQDLAAALAKGLEKLADKP